MSAVIDIFPQNHQNKKHKFGHWNSESSTAELTLFVTENKNFELRMKMRGPSMPVFITEVRF